MRKPLQGGWVLLLTYCASCCRHCGSLPFSGQDFYYTETVNIQSATRGNHKGGQPMRSRRSSDLPLALDLNFRLGNRNVSLGLRRNSALDNFPLVYLVHGNELEILSVSKGEKGFYQDPYQGASFSVRHQEEGNGYYYTGTYFSRGEQLSVVPAVQLSSPLRGRSGKHDVSKIRLDIDLTNDYLELQGVAAESSTKGDDTSFRVRRQTTGRGNFVVELLLVVDYGVYELWLQQTKGPTEEMRKQAAIERITEYYSFVLNGIDMRYASIQSNFSIDVSFAGIIIFDNPHDTYWSGGKLNVNSPRDMVEASDALEAFRSWALKLGPNLPPSDHVMLFTGFNLTYGGSVSNAGLAYLGSACNDLYYFSIVEEYFEFRTVAIAAHELGHSLGARHDMDGNTCMTFDRYIMTSRFRFSTARTAQNPWKFSSCSVEYFSEFIDDLNRNDTNCLLTNDAISSNTEIKPYLVFQPGEVYPGDQFCQLSEGLQSYICRDQHADGYRETCYSGIYCYRPSSDDCDLKLPPDGMSCGDQKWCVNGTCIFSELAPTAVDDNCPFSDDVQWFVEGKNCSRRVHDSPMQCYDKSFRARCCSSCAQAKRNLLDCEYGDHFDKCQEAQCPFFEKQFVKDNCCDTCAEKPVKITTKAATITTTSPATTSTSVAPLTTTTKPKITANDNFVTAVPIIKTSGTIMTVTKVASTTSLSDVPVTSELGDSTNITESSNINFIKENSTDAADDSSLSSSQVSFAPTSRHSMKLSPALETANFKNNFSDSTSAFLTQFTPLTSKVTLEEPTASLLSPNDNGKGNWSSAAPTSPPGQKSTLLPTSVKTTSTTLNYWEDGLGFTFDPFWWISRWRSWYSKVRFPPEEEEEEEGDRRPGREGRANEGGTGGRQGIQRYLTGGPPVDYFTLDPAVTSHADKGRGEREGSGRRWSQSTLGYTVLYSTVTSEPSKNAGNGSKDDRGRYFTGQPPSDSHFTKEPAVTSVTDNGNETEMAGKGKEGERTVFKGPSPRGDGQRGQEEIEHEAEEEGVTSPRPHHRKRPSPDIFFSDPLMTPNLRNWGLPSSSPEIVNDEHYHLRSGDSRPTTQSSLNGKNSDSAQRGHGVGDGGRPGNRGLGGRSNDGGGFFWWRGDGTGSRLSKGDNNARAGHQVLTERPDNGNEESAAVTDPTGGARYGGKGSVQDQTKDTGSGNQGNGGRAGDDGSDVSGRRNEDTDITDQKDDDVSSSSSEEGKLTGLSYLRSWRVQRARQQRRLHKAREQHVQRVRHLLLSTIKRGVTNGQRLTALLDMLELLQNLRNFRILSSDIAGSAVTSHHSQQSPLLPPITSSAVSNSSMSNATKRQTLKTNDPPEENGNDSSKSLRENDVKRKNLRMRLNRLFGSIVDGILSDFASTEEPGGVSRRKRSLTMTLARRHALKVTHREFASFLHHLHPEMSWNVNVQRLPRSKRDVSDTFPQRRHSPPEQDSTERGRYSMAALSRGNNFQANRDLWSRTWEQNYQQGDLKKGSATGTPSRRMPNRGLVLKNSRNEGVGNSSDDLALGRSKEHGHSGDIPLPDSVTRGSHFKSKNTFSSYVAMFNSHNITDDKGNAGSLSKNDAEIGEVPLALDTLGSRDVDIVEAASQVNDGGIYVDDKQNDDDSLLGNTDSREIQDTLVPDSNIDPVADDEDLKMIEDLFHGHEDPFTNDEDLIVSPTEDGVFDSSVQNLDDTDLTLSDIADGDAEHDEKDNIPGNIVLLSNGYDASIEEVPKVSEALSSEVISDPSVGVFISNDHDDDTSEQADKTINTDVSKSVEESNCDFDQPDIDTGSLDLHKVDLHQSVIKANQLVRAVLEQSDVLEIPDSRQTDAPSKSQPGPHGTTQPDMSVGNRGPMEGPDKTKQSGEDYLDHMSVRNRGPMEGADKTKQSGEDYLSQDSVDTLQADTADTIQANRRVSSANNTASSPANQQAESSERQQTEAVVSTAQGSKRETKDLGISEKHGCSHHRIVSAVVHKKHTYFVDNNYSGVSHQLLPNDQHSSDKDQIDISFNKDQKATPESSDKVQPANPDSSDKVQPANPDSSDKVQPANPDSSDKDQLANPDSSDKDQLAIPDSSDKDQLAIPDSSDKDQLALPDSSDKDQLSTPDSSDKDQLAIPDSTDKDQLAIPDSRYQIDIDRLATPDASDKDQSATPDSSDKDQPAILISSDKDQPTIPDSSGKDQTAIQDSSDKDQTATPDSSDKDQPAIPDSSDKDQPAIPDSSDKDQTAIPDSSDKNQAATPDNSSKDQSAIPDSSDKYQPAIPDSSDKNQTAVPYSSDIDQAAIPDSSDKDQPAISDSSDKDQPALPDSSNKDQPALPDSSDKEPAIPDSSDKDQRAIPVNAAKDRSENDQLDKADSSEDHQQDKTENQSLDMAEKPNGTNEHNSANEHDSNSKDKQDIMYTTGIPDKDNSHKPDSHDKDLRDKSDSSDIDQLGFPGSPQRDHDHETDISINDQQEQPQKPTSSGSAIEDRLDGLDRNHPERFDKEREEPDAKLADTPSIDKDNLDGSVEDTDSGTSRRTGSPMSGWNSNGPDKDQILSGIEQSDRRDIVGDLTGSSDADKGLPDMLDSAEQPSGSAGEFRSTNNQFAPIPANNSPDGGSDTWYGRHSGALEDRLEMLLEQLENTRFHFQNEFHTEPSTTSGYLFSVLPKMRKKQKEDQNEYNPVTIGGLNSAFTAPPSGHGSELLLKSNGQAFKTFFTNGITKDGAKTTDGHSTANVRREKESSTVSSTQGTTRLGPFSPHRSGTLSATQKATPELSSIGHVLVTNTGEHLKGITPTLVESDDVTVVNFTAKEIDYVTGKLEEARRRNEDEMSFQHTNSNKTTLQLLHGNVTFPSSLNLLGSSTNQSTSPENSTS